MPTCARFFGLTHLTLVVQNFNFRLGLLTSLLSTQIRSAESNLFSHFRSFFISGCVLHYEIELGCITLQWEWKHGTHTASVTKKVAHKYILTSLMHFPLVSIRQRAHNTAGRTSTQISQRRLFLKKVYSPPFKSIAIGQPMWAITYRLLC